MWSRAECWLAGWQADPAYIAAHDTYNTAVENKQQADASASAAAVELEAAIAEAAKLKHECECRVLHQLEAAWDAASSSGEASQRAWTQAHHMICVVDNLTYENCVVPPRPQVPVSQASA